jgi:hypothetical protein
MGTQQSYTAKVQLVLISLLGLSFILLAQQANKGIYQAGLWLLIISAMLQIIFGNIPATASFKKMMLLFVVGLVLLIGVFALGILLTPGLVNLGRG